MYKILFIDEEPDDIDAFKEYVHETNSNETFEVISEYPLEDIDEMIDVIFMHNPDAIVTDFMLNEIKEAFKHNVPYNGVQLLQEILNRRESFPCFVMTSFDDNAIKVSEDVNRIYIKNILHGSEKGSKAKATFLERVESQIKHYKSKIDVAETKLIKLMKKRAANEADIDDENEIIRLDHFLENAIDKRNSIPEDYKSLSNTKQLEQILTKVDELIKKVDNKDGK